MTPHKKYDYIIAGMGCAGLSLALQLKRSSLSFTRILLIDKDLKNKNDRTWCFWTKEKNNWYNEIIFKSWNHFSFNGEDFQSKFDLTPYQYVMIRGVDFYSHCLNEIKTDSRFEIHTDEIQNLGTNGDHAFLKTSAYTYYANYIFNSAFRNLKVKRQHVNYVQHFKGWLVETDTEEFNTDCPVFMDFDVLQNNDCRFIYLIPIAKNKALIEYTGFSKKGLENKDYDDELSNYLTNNLKINAYRIKETEQGEIPMVESEFINPFGKRIINIGTAGGSSKPSTGYTFYFIQRHIKQLMFQLENKMALHSVERKNRYKLYDKILLDVIDRKEISAKKIFTALFKKNKIETVLAFLNEESSLKQDLLIMNSVPRKIFIFSAFRKIAVNFFS